MPARALTDEAVLARVEAVNVWRRGDERAPHKPLLLLFALARLQRGEPRLVAYEEVEPALRSLLVDFGPPRRSVHPEFPFWYLQNDEGLWEIPERPELVKAISGLKRKKSVPSRVLKECEAQGGFPHALFAYLRERKALVNDIVARILEQHFPTSLHEDILDAVGMPWVVSRTRRDPRFREESLRSYEQRCAICGYDGRLGRSGLGLEAAHIRSGMRLEVPTSCKTGSRYACSTTRCSTWGRSVWTTRGACWFRRTCTDRRR